MAVYREARWRPDGWKSSINIVWKIREEKCDVIDFWEIKHAFPTRLETNLSPQKWTKHSKTDADLFKYAWIILFSAPFSLPSSSFPSSPFLWVWQQSSFSCLLQLHLLITIFCSSFQTNALLLYLIITHLVPIIPLFFSIFSPFILPHLFPLTIIIPCSALTAVIFREHSSASAVNPSLFRAC